MATVRDPLGAWYGTEKPDHYRTRGGEVFRVAGNAAGGWFARVAGVPRLRGPLSSMDAAMAAVDKMLATTRQNERS